MIFDDEFNALDASRWGELSSAYPGNEITNPTDNKLDQENPSAISVANGQLQFTATPSGNGAWNTGLLTTENASGFQARTGDYVETRVKLPTQLGAWPAVWTWKDGGNEIDSFEYHPDNPAILELTNHVNFAYDYLNDPSQVGPGQWITIGTLYGADSVEWFVNGTLVYSDGHGVGPTWSAYLIVNLSIANGIYHPAPTTPDPIAFSVDYIRVYG